MAFKDTPQIDRFSKNSNISEVALEGCLNQAAGYICRRDVPDKGCDYDVELIENGTNITAWRFALQLKSVEKLTFVSDGTHISYNIETSRLGYIMRRIPARGLIVLYSLEQNKMFYDYADKIYERLMTDRDSDAWQDNDTVNIRIPIENVMDSDGVKKIHDIFINRFRSAAQMQSSHGAKYGLPTTNLSGDTGYDWNNLDDVKKMLVEYGIFLLNNYDLHIVYELISRLSHNEICADRELLKLAAATYCEIGMYSEARLYNKRFLKSTGITPNEKMVSDYIELKIGLGLGEVSIQDFIATATDISNRDTNEHNKIMLEINVTFYKLLELKADEEIPESIKLSINDVQLRIKKVRLSLPTLKRCLEYGMQRILA
ncbi:DUF4365 domain-containing protein [Arachidicoccus sp.]|uniref:DUF4365 domain-containing protein n=1 Tax=Arachidicoccus sp. TaxID=1872624 RepID=UPI003D1EC38D